MDLPKPLAAHPDAAAFQPAPQPRHLYEEELCASPTAIPRLGPTVWYRPGKGVRSVALHQRDGEIVGQEFWSFGKRDYAREIYRGSDLYEACAAANAAFDQLKQEGFKAHTQYNLGIQEWFGLDTAWDHDVFDADRILDGLRRREAFRAEREAEAEKRREYAEAQGLVPMAPSITSAPKERARPSSLAERTGAPA